MPSFGEKLKHERENRETTIEEISAATGIGLSYLEALERNEFEALPGPAFGKLYIRAYAEVLEFDPGPLLADYDREQQVRKMNEPPEGRPPKPIMVRPKMPAQDEPPGDEREVPAEKQREEPVEAKITEEVEEALVETEPAPVEPPARTSLAAPAFEETLRASEGTRGRRRVVLVAALIGVPLLIVIAWILSGGLGGDDTGSEPTTSTATLDNVSETKTPPASSNSPHDPSGGPSAGGVQPESPERPTEPVVERDVDLSPVAAGKGGGGLVVDEFGVGRNVVNHRLEDRDDRFTEGEVVWFLTRVQGGRRGERIRHVWLHEGAAVQSIDLVIGGPHWRTQSNKTLWGVGSWAVEVRDDDDRVLARTTFTCVSR